MKHVEEWIEEKTYGNATPMEKYARAFLFLKGMSAVENIIVQPILSEAKL